MEAEKKYFIFIFMILMISVSALTAACAYTGTGFSHSIPTSTYSDMSASDILNKYSDTECHVEETATCTKVVDGDTIYLDNGEKIRFVGVNTPERGVEGYITSKNFVQKLCLNKEVGIDIDDSKHNDKYGRTLAVVIVDGKNVNEMLLKEGLAEVMRVVVTHFVGHLGNVELTVIDEFGCTFHSRITKQVAGRLTQEGLDLLVVGASTHAGGLCHVVDRIVGIGKIALHVGDDRVDESLVGR